MHAVIKAIEYYLPTHILTNDDLANRFPEWTPKKIEEKLGVVERHIAADEECASDLGVAAAHKLFARGVCSPDEIDFLLLCTQSPDYFLPTTACMLQDRLGLSTTTGALDFNLGCSGFVYGLSLAKGLIETGQAHTVLLITAETYSKFIHPNDQSVRTVFGDGAAATLIQGKDEAPDQAGPWIGPIVFGTDGRGAPNLIVPQGGMRQRGGSVGQVGDTRSEANLFMNGPEIFTFTLRVVPASVKDILARSERSLETIDWFVFHQPNQYMLEHLRKKLKIPAEKFCTTLRFCGNTVSSTIPLALKHAQEDGKLQHGQTVMLSGFGVGYSWATGLIRWFEG
jgi:3-oxoacyl-[acyl-carrier-protein] synthase-3